MGRVVRIYVCPEAGAAMSEMYAVQAVAGVGLLGDRYAGRLGAFSKSGRKVIRHVTLISADDIMAANRTLEVPFGVSETRRNIVTVGIDLKPLIGVKFSVGMAVFRGVELCEPCERPSKLSGKTGFAEAFAGRGGIRAEVVTDGAIAGEVPSSSSSAAGPRTRFFYGQ